MDQLFYGQCQTVGVSEGVCVCVCMRVCVCVCMCVCMHVCVCMCVAIELDYSAVVWVFCGSEFSQYCRLVTNIHSVFIVGPTYTGSQFVNVEKLGAYPLEVRGCTDLYESLAAATFSRYGTAGEPRRSFSHDSIHEVRMYVSYVVHCVRGVCKSRFIGCFGRTCTPSSSLCFPSVLPYHCTPLPISIIPSLPHLFSPCSSSFSCTLLSLSSKIFFPPHLTSSSTLSLLVHPSLYFTSHHYFWYSLFLLPSPLQCWFSRLPPVMILELSRFEFDQTSKRVEKINDQLTFEQVLYMDRFLLKNSKDTLMRHSREVELRVKLDELKEEYQA